MPPVSVIVTAYKRLPETLATLRKLQECRPPPQEILVHVDGNNESCAAAIRSAFPAVRVLISENNVGPGGSRNQLVSASRCEIIASFDDDSYPIDVDYFARVQQLFNEFPAASILTAALYERGQAIELDDSEAAWVSDFAGCACIYRREAFLSSGGYVPLPVAYGMEEVDLALRLHARGGRILKTRRLRVFHDTDLNRHADPQVTGFSIANLALLAYLRYPPVCWAIGLGQCLNRILWLIRNGRWAGILRGIGWIPSHVRANRRHRSRLTASQVRSYLALRRTPLRAKAAQ